MDLTHRFSVPATREEAWTTFSQLGRLAPCFPGATLTSVQGDEFSGSFKVKLGPIVLLYEGSGRYADRDEHHGQLVIETQGRDKRGNGTANATSTITLSGHGDHTDVEVRTDLTLTGKPAQLGRGVIADVNDKLLDQFSECLTGRFTDASWDTDDEDGSDPGPTAEPEQTPADVHTDPTLAESGRGGSLDGVDAPPDVDTAPIAKPAPTRPAPPRTYDYTPPKNAAESDFSVVSTVAPALLKRYWPVLAGASVALLITSKVIKGARR